VGALTLHNAEAIHAQIAEALSSGAALAIDCTDTEQWDVIPVQLLLAARRSATARGLTCMLSAPASGPLLDVLVRGGFFDPNNPDALPDGGFWAGRSV
jgi:STAS domain.